MRRRVINIMLCLLMIVAFFSVEVPSNVSGQLTEEWIARYDGHGNWYDNARAIAVDSSGNVYVTGQSWGNGTDYDYATIKYDTNGNQVWIDRYNGPKNVGDESYDIAVDEEGNVYVTGHSGYLTSIGTRCDYATIKYDTNGNRMWVARYHNAASLGDYIPNDFGQGIAVDKDGNVYVTGSSYGVTQEGGSPSLDIATVKYDNDGNELWIKRYDAGASDRCYWDCIAVDEDGNVYVTGYSYGIGTGNDIVTLKYDTNGNELWVTRYNGPANRWDEGAHIAIDKYGNVYVTGWSIGSETGYDSVTLKYDANGNEQWVTRYDGPANASDGSEKIIVDEDGNVYVTGPSSSIHLYDYATIKYDTNGFRVWIDRYNGPGDRGDYATAIAVDEEGNVYVTGWSMGFETGHDYATVAYDSSGNQLWVKRYNGPGNGNDRANAIAVDSSGNIYVTGQSIGDSTYDFCTIKYSKYSPVEAIEDLITLIENMNLQQGIDNSLDAKLGSVLNALDDVNENNDVAAINALGAFINAVWAQRGNKINEADADSLIAAAQKIITMLSE